MSDTIGKIRGRYTDEVFGLAQWMGRKLRNHDPMSERDGSPGEANKRKQGHRYVQDGKVEKGIVYCGVVAGSPNVIRYGLIDGRIFEITVREIMDEESTPKLIAVGA